MSTTRNCIARWLLRIREFLTGYDLRHNIGDHLDRCAFAMAFSAQAEADRRIVFEDDFSDAASVLANHPDAVVRYLNQRAHYWSSDRHPHPLPFWRARGTMDVLRAHPGVFRGHPVEPTLYLVAVNRRVKGPSEVSITPYVLTAKPNGFQKGKADPDLTPAQWYLMTRWQHDRRRWFVSSLCFVFAFGPWNYLLSGPLPTAFHLGLWGFFLICLAISSWEFLIGTGRVFRKAFRSMRRSTRNVAAL